MAMMARADPNTRRPATPKQQQPRIIKDPRIDSWTFSHWFSACCKRSKAMWRSMARADLESSCSSFRYARMDSIPPMHSLNCEKMGPGARAGEQQFHKRAARVSFDVGTPRHMFDLAGTTPQAVFQVYRTHLGSMNLSACIRGSMLGNTFESKCNAKDLK